MKIKLIIILISFAFSSKGQISILEYSNDILIGPEMVGELSSEVIEFYLKDYLEKKSILEVSLEAAESIEKEILIKKDIDVIGRYLMDWEVEKAEDAFLIFLENYDTSKCYEIESTNGNYVQGAYEIEKTIGEVFTIYEEIEVEKKSAHTKWVKKKIENCNASNPADCYVACLDKTPETFVIKETGESLPTHKLSKIYSFDADNSQLIREIEFVEHEFRIVSKDSGELLIIIGWIERDCE